MTKPQTRIVTIAGTQHAAAPGCSSSRRSWMTSPVAATISRSGEGSFVSSICNSSPHGEAVHDRKSELRTPPSPELSPPPVASDPNPTAPTTNPGSRHPHRVNIRGYDVFAWHPDILNAVPAPVARLPDIARSRWRGHHLGNGGGRSETHYDPDAGYTGGGGERQRRGA